MHKTRQRTHKPSAAKSAAPEQASSLAGRPFPLTAPANAQTPTAESGVSGRNLAQPGHTLANISIRASATQPSLSDRPIQLAAERRPVQPVAADRSADRAGLPDTLKAGVESLSGISMDHVRVHYNSPRPAQLSALAYAQGDDIHVAPGQERHLPHEAWHLVQQAQGRVRPTLQARGGAAVNADQGLEREADVMGSRAVRGGAPEGGVVARTAPPPHKPATAAVAQLKVKMKGSGTAKRTDGTLQSLRDEVAATIGRGDLSEILEDIAKLSTSITNRRDDNGKFEPHTEAWETHRVRFQTEKDLLKQLEDKKQAIEAAKAPKKKKPAAKPAASGGNMFALLGDSGD